MRRFATLIWAGINGRYQHTRAFHPFSPLSGAFLLFYKAHLKLWKTILQPY
ncbi:hypothetical protein SAMN04490203_4205 [Pseudomonas taetrolens]|uniref:Uncharacterized protein n=1 Tax=Pseudomonas taetrolens TaxID=47884 RepID=A0A1H5BT87_PSETA|nr:hypothetical protein SAMN04490203_4205 [Pseudomonas taetrolens]SQF88219.1 Uncharacterised protein [Pseudomonas taetrolens]VEH51409.1 Uncharacterised protein [Pseudomonas taetrolens]